MIWLISKDMFYFIKNWSIEVFILTLVLHTIAFYFYAKYKNKKEAVILSKAINKVNK
ncbi:hypothetical protein [Miniphocaeibacter massiliensis]|uniref:hypothetical protein n=1 Tax=Miniphocaeibacter massiliensis TaxID=2041841 RepID=UPI0013EBBA82|nr:hypothetical protein [Miniphocaeibacter massiliensis]